MEKELSRIIQTGLYELHLAPHETVIGDAKQDAAELICALPANARCIVWKGDRLTFPFMRQHKCADGAILTERGDGSFDAHIIEIKLTINQDSRHKAKLQMAWTLVRLQTLAGALGLRIEGARLYTAYLQDQLAKDPGLLKVPLGDVGTLSGEEADAAAALKGQFDWPEQEVELRGFEGRFAHQAIRLNPPAKVGEVATGRCAL